MKTKILGTIEVLVTETGRLWGIKYLYTSASINRVAHEMEQPDVFPCVGVTCVCTPGPLHIVTCIFSWVTRVWSIKTRRFIFYERIFPSLIYLILYFPDWFFLVLNSPLFLLWLSCNYPLLNLNIEFFKYFSVPSTFTLKWGLVLVS